MLLGELGGNPDDGDSLKARCVGEKLTQVGMVGALKLVLDQNPVAGLHILAEKISPEGTNIALLSLKLQLKPNCFGQNSEVLRLCEPRRKVRGFADPDLAEVHPFKTAEWFSHAQAQ